MIDSKKMFEIRLCLQPWITQVNFGQSYFPGSVLESSGQADFQNVPGFDNWTRFAGVIEQNKIPVHSKC